MSVDLSMYNWSVIEKIEGNAHCCHLLFIFLLKIVYPRFYVNGNGFLPAVWKFEAKLMSTTPSLVFYGIDHAFESFERNISPPGEGGLF